MITVDGNWGSWESWTTCSTTCGDGVETRNRLCNDPEPVDGGAGNAADCPTDAAYTDLPLNGGLQEQQDERSCNDMPCPSK